MESSLLMIIVLFLVVAYVGECVLMWLNIKTFDQPLPTLVSTIYDRDDYLRSQQYLKCNSVFELICGGFALVCLGLVLVFNGFELLDQLLRGVVSSSVWRGVSFFIILGISWQLITLPFSLYKTFVIESKFGFNKTTAKTYIIDCLKMIVISLIIGVPVMAVVLWFFTAFTHYAWVYVWGSLLMFQLLMLFIAPTCIMPLFNRYEPLKDKDLERVIMDYSNAQHFSLKGVFQMDGSKRSSKSNAFFTGFGPFKRVVLFDTLIANHCSASLRVIVAHEVGHYKKKHLLKMFVVGSLTMGAMLFFLGWAVQTPHLSRAFGFSQFSVYASLLVFSFLYQPLDHVVSVFINMLSRKHEYEADAFAVQTTGDSTFMIEALKKLSKDNLSHLTPHPWVVFLSYSHPTLLQRIGAIRAVAGAKN